MLKNMVKWSRKMEINKKIPVFDFKLGDKSLLK